MDHSANGGGSWGDGAGKSTDHELSVAMVAGEASGDLLAGILLEGMKQRWTHMRSFGIGGPKMVRHGFQAWWPHHKLSVHGFSVELLMRYREIVGIREQLRDRLLASPPTLFIGVDAPDFNLDLEASLKSQGIRTVHFVCPSVWAWRAERIEKLRRSVDHVLCIFPFEPALLEKHGVAATFVGHPLANVIPMKPDRKAAREKLLLNDTDEVVAILPGSRISEIKHLAPRFFAAATLMQRARPGIRFMVPAIPGLKGLIERYVRASGIGDALTVLEGQSHLALEACDMTLIASGTATLEAALFKRPMVISYHMGWLSWKLMNPKRLQPWVGLPNILLEDFVVPELLQQSATPEALAEASLAWLEDLSNRAGRTIALVDNFESLHRSLLRDTATIAANAIQKVVRS